MIRITNLDQVIAQHKAWLAAVKVEVEQIAIGMMKVMLGQALIRSPQYSGDFVANYKVSIGTIDRSFKAGIFPDKTFPITEGSPFRRGDTPAISYAIRANDGKADGFKLGTTLWLANNAAHDDLYAWKIEDNLFRLRPQNFGGEGPMRGVKEYMKIHFGRITKSNREFLR